MLTISPSIFPSATNTSYCVLIFSSILKSVAVLLPMLSSLLGIFRDFKDFRSIGARLQRDAINDFQPTIVVTMHESPDEGFHMFSEGKLPAHFKSAIGNKLSRENIPLASKNFLHMKLKNGIWEKPRFIFFIQRVLKIHTLGRYLYERRIPALTTESTWGSKDMAARRRPHMLVVRALLEKS